MKNFKKTAKLESLQMKFLQMKLLPKFLHLDPNSTPEELQPFAQEELSERWQSMTFEEKVALVRPAVACLKKMHQKGEHVDPLIAVTVEHFRLRAAMEYLTEKLKATEHERDTALKERDTALSERDTALKERDTALSERDTALSERDTALKERDTALSERDTALSERDTALKERDTVKGERDSAITASDKAIKYRAKAEDERNFAVLGRAAALAALEATRSRRIAVQVQRLLHTLKSWGNKAVKMLCIALRLD